MKKFDILIIEDEELERKVLVELVSTRVANVGLVKQAQNGREAIALIDAMDFDLVLSDINMPNVNGLHVIKHLKKKNQKTKVIMATAYDEYEFLHTALKLKADDYLLKPIKPKVLIAAIETCLKQDDIAPQEKQNDAYLYKLKKMIGNGSYTGAVSLTRQLIKEAGGLTQEKSDSLIRAFSRDLLAYTYEKEMKVVPRIEELDQKIALSIEKSSNSFEVANILIKMIDLIFDESSEIFGEPDDKMKKALNYIERNIKKSITLQDVAEYVNVSSYYLSRMFKQEMNVNYITYLTARKIEIAKEMLGNTDQPVLNVALELSYSDANYFSKVFKKNVGITPIEYREQHLKP